MSRSLDTHSVGAHAGASRERDGDDPRRESNQELPPEIVIVLDFLAIEALRQLVTGLEREAGAPQDVPSPTDEQPGS